MLASQSGFPLYKRFRLKYRGKMHHIHEEWLWHSLILRKVNPKGLTKK